MQDGIAVVKVNNIEVGSMPVSQYEEIVKSVKKDWRTRVASVFFYVRFIWRQTMRVWSLFVQSFSVIIAFFMLYSVFHQSELTQFITEMRHSPSEDVAGFIRTIATICISSTFIAGVIGLFLKGIPQFVSATEDAINKKIREVMEVPADGQVSITFKKVGIGVYDVR